MYNKAMARGLYNSVNVHGPQGSNGPVRAYACSNCMEFFAELSTAFLWADGKIVENLHVVSSGTDISDNQESTSFTNIKDHAVLGDNIVPHDTCEVVVNRNEEYNKWFPHNKQQLKDYDYCSYSTLDKVWSS